RIAKKLCYIEINSFVTNTFIHFTLHSESFPIIFRITYRDTNFIKISQAIIISRKIKNNEISLAEAKTQLEKI
ncbi:threonine/serine exporter family protein, partial [Staphylococcus aureus]|nr:threonine/serine exporter family protein [Staphylococcus aureus]